MKKSGLSYAWHLCLAILLIAGIPTNAEAGINDVTRDADGLVTTISSVEDLKAFRDDVNSGKNYSGKTVTLNANLDMSSVDNWVPIGIGGGTTKSFCGTFDGNGFTISNLKSNNKNYAGLFGTLYGYVKNLKMKDVDITSTHYAGGIAAFLGSENGKEISQCSVSGGTITSTPELVNDKYDNGDKVGGILGYMAGRDKVTGCTVENVTIQGYRDLGGIVGMANGTSTVSGCTVTGITIIQDNENGYKTYSEVKNLAQAIAGRVASGATVTDNTSSNVTIKHINFGVAKIGDVEYETLQAALDAAEAADDKNIVIELLADATLDVNAWDGTKNPLSIGTVNTESITINGNNHKLTFNHKNSDWNNVATMNDAKTKLILNDMAITNSGYNNSAWNRHDINFNCDVTLNNVTSDKALAFKNGATLKNVTVADAGDVYNIWIQTNGQNINIDGLTINGERGIKIDDQYLIAPKNTTVNIANATFNTKKKSAILVKSNALTEINVGEGINIENVAADKEYLVWVDEDKATEFWKVTVTGAKVNPETKEEDYVASLIRGEQIRGYYKTFLKAYNSTDYVEDDIFKLHQNTSEELTVAKYLMIIKNGYKADNIVADETQGYKRFETDETIVIRLFHPICAIGEEKYESLQEAVDAAGTNEVTITLLTEAATDGVISGDGVKVPSGSKITFDLNGLTYNVSGSTVGSAKTQTQGFQLLKESDITFKNGTLKATSPDAQMLIQNYCNLTLEDVTLDGTQLQGQWAYALSNNSGAINLTGSTSITAKDGGRAFDTCKFGKYSIPTVTINTTGAITGLIEATGGKLVIENGKFDVTFDTDKNYTAGDIQIKGGVFTDAAKEATKDEYLAEGYVFVENEAEETKDAYPWTVMSKEQAGIFELLDWENYPFVDYTSDVNAKSVTYTRKFTESLNNKHQSWFVPMDYQIKAEDAEYFKFYKIHMIAGAAMPGEADPNTIYLYVESLKEGDVLVGNRPYTVVVIKNTPAEGYVFKQEGMKLYAPNYESRLNVTTSGNSYDFYGTYVQHTYSGQAGDLNFLSSGTIHPSSAKVTLRQYRWNIQVKTNGTNDGYSKPEFVIVEDADATGISDAVSDEVLEEVEGIYSVNGMKLASPSKGINIIKYKSGKTIKMYIK